MQTAEIETLRRWIARRDVCRTWALIAPVARPLPSVQIAPGRATASILGAQPARIRRVEARAGGRQIHDPPPRQSRLRGLPPTPKEVETYAADSSDEAYEKAVDRFLDDPAYGERWAQSGSTCRVTPIRRVTAPTVAYIRRFRDWVIDAFNNNLPYDRFTIEQFAGDLLPNPTLDQKIATAFHRNTMTNTEGGTDDEEFRTAAVKDRVDTTWSVWLGLTMGWREVS